MTGGDAKILVRIAESGDAERIRAAGLGGAAAGDWHEIAAADDEATARRLSKSLDLTTVWVSIHAAVELVEIKCFEHGKELRHLLHTPEDGWIARSGDPLPFEASAALARWLAAPPLLADVHDYEVLACALGNVPTGLRDAGVTADSAADSAH